MQRINHSLRIPEYLQKGLDKVSKGLTDNVRTASADQAELAKGAIRVVQAERMGFANHGFGVYEDGSGGIWYKEGDMIYRRDSEEDKIVAAMTKKAFDPGTPLEKAGYRMKVDKAGDEYLYGLETLEGEEILPPIYLYVDDVITPNGIIMLKDMDGNKIRHFLEPDEEEELPSPYEDDDPDMYNGAHY